MANDDYSPERLADRAAIYDVMCRYCRGVDRLDYETLRSAYHEDAIDNHGPFNGTADGFVEWVRNRHKTIPFSQHLIGNVLIEFTGPDEAVVETYNITTQRYPAEARPSLEALLGDVPGDKDRAVDLIVNARYVDHVTRRNGEWRIQTRNVALDSTNMIEVPKAGFVTVDEQIRGRRDSGDILYELRAQLGL